MIKPMSFRQEGRRKGRRAGLAMRGGDASKLRCSGEKRRRDALPSRKARTLSNWGELEKSIGFIKGADPRFQVGNRSPKALEDIRTVFLIKRKERVWGE